MCLTLLQPRVKQSGAPVFKQPIVPPGLDPLLPLFVSLLVTPFVTYCYALDRAAEASSGRSATNMTAGVTTCAPVVRRRTMQTKRIRLHYVCTMC